MKRRPASRALLGLFLLACAGAPKPPLLAQAIEQEDNPALQAAARLAPQAFAHAEQLRRAADDAHTRGDERAAQLLADQALAAQQQTLVQARLVQADERLRQAAAERARLELQISALRAEQERVAADARALELRVKVVRDAEPISPPEPASPEREMARTQAARLLLEDARLLCLAAQLLGVEPNTLDAPFAALDALEHALDAKTRPVPIDAAYKARSTCLSTLSERRLLAGRRDDASVAADELLRAVAAALPDGAAHRDDRGVVVVIPMLREPGAGPVLAPGAKATLETLAAVAKGAGTPVLIAAHAPADPWIEQLRESPIGALPRTRIEAAVLRRYPAANAGARPGGNEWAEVILVTP